LILGEIAFEGTWSFFNSGLLHRKQKNQEYMNYYWSKVKAVSKRIATYIDLYRERDISGIMPYEMLQWATDPDDPRGLENQQTPLSYPALSGPGQKPTEASVCVLKYVNWYNPALPKGPQNLATDTITDHYEPQPLPPFNTYRPEIIVRVMNGSKPIVGVPVVLWPGESVAASPIGSVTDSEGRAWVVLPEGGPCTAVISLADRTLRVNVQPEQVREFSVVKTVVVEVE
jgi:hypothetical protein